MAPYNNLGVYAVGPSGNNRRILIRNPWWGSTWDAMVASAGTPPGPPEMYEFVMVTQLYLVNQGFYEGYLRFAGAPDWYDGNAYITNSSHTLSASQYGL
jgi:hypothetical protein